MEGPVGHTFVSFSFDKRAAAEASRIENAAGREAKALRPRPPLCSSNSEVDLRGGEGARPSSAGAPPTTGMSRSIFIASNTSADDARRPAGDLTWSGINHLADHPEFYHLLTNSCTINIVRYANAAGRDRAGFDIRHVLNGLADSYLYSFRGPH